MDKTQIHTSHSKLIDHKRLIGIMLVMALVLCAFSVAAFKTSDVFASEDTQTPPATCQETSSANMQTDAVDSSRESNISHTVTFVANGHGTAPATQQIEDGKNATDPGAITGVEGYTHDGCWYTESACTNKFDFNTSITQDINLYAKWTINTYVVVFSAEGGAPQPGNQTVEYGGKVTKPADPTKEGYKFLGWYIEEPVALSGKWDFDTMTVKSYLQLVAHWEKQNTDNPVTPVNDTTTTTSADNATSASVSNTMSTNTSQTGDFPISGFALLTIMLCGASVARLAFRRMQLKK